MVHIDLVFCLPNMCLNFSNQTLLGSTPQGRYFLVPLDGAAFSPLDWLEWGCIIFQYSY